MGFSSFIASLSLILWACAFLYLRSYIRKRTAPDHILGEFKEEIAKMVSTIDAATDRDITLVEDRIKSLRAVLEEADKRIALSRRELEKQSDGEKAYAELGRRAQRSSSFQAPAIRSQAPSEAPRPDVSDLSFETDRSAAPREQPVQRTARAEVPDEGLRITRSANPVIPKAPPFAQRVAELYRSGFSADLIASSLKATVAEVDLAIALISRGEADYGSNTGN